MAILLCNKNEVELQAAPGSRRIHYKVLATLALAALTTLSFAQNGTRDHTRPPSRQLQPRASPSAPPRPLVTQSSSSSRHAMPVSRANGGTRIEHQLSSGHRVLEITQATPGSGMLHAVRYGTALTGVVEHPVKSRYLSRTYVQGGHVIYARVYRQNTFQRFGHAFSYESLVPAVAFGTAYYAWAARPWSTPVSYRWRWEAEPWHAAFGGDFTPYPNYMSLDEWLTDYVIAQSLRNAYESWQAENAPERGPVAAEVPPAAAPPAAGDRPYWESPDDGRQPYWEESPGSDTRAQPNSSKTRNSLPRDRKSVV